MDRDSSATMEPFQIEEPFVAAETPPPRWRLFTTFASLVLAIFLVSLDMTIVATAIPRVSQEFHTLEDIGWYGSAFFLTLAAFQSSWGKIFKYFDLKWTFVSAVVLFEAGSVACATAPSSKTLVVGRAITGIGAAGVVSGCYCILGYSVLPRQRPFYTGLLGGVYAVASAIGPLLGGILTDHLSWRWCFWINLPCGGAAVSVIIFSYHTPQVQYTSPARSASWSEKIRQMDISGVILCLGALVMLLLALQWGGTSKTWQSTTVILLLVFSGVVATAFLVCEYIQEDRAMIDFWLIQQRMVWSGAAFICFIGASFFVLVYFLPLYFQVVLGTSAEESGVRNLALVVATTAAAALAGGLMTKFGLYTPVVVFGSMISLLGCILVSKLDRGSTVAEWAVYQVVAGFGLGLAIQTPLLAAQALAHPDDLSIITATLVFFQTMGGCIFVSTAQCIFSNILLKAMARYEPDVDPDWIIKAGATGLKHFLSDGLYEYAVMSYMEALSAVFSLVIALASVAVVLTWFVPWIRLNPQTLTYE